ncbi:glycoside hydrolase family 15 protein [Microbacterium sp. DT81.1]|uniref:glycoside hydrolase family 15 protein n=1 Tax=Microbacterium sp. DT81.1 TaxID=3393413 RepID=UPI003CF81524
MSQTPIAEYAFLSNSRTSALVSRDGRVDWLCLPRFDSTPAHARLLDEDAGYLALRPADPRARAERRYLPQSLVLETTWTSAAGELRVRDALSLGENERGHDLGLNAPSILLRDAECVSGEVEVLVEWCPRPEFGLIHPRLGPVAGGFLALGGATQLLLSIEAPLSTGVVGASGTIALAAGDHLTLALEQSDAWDTPPAPLGQRQVIRRIENTQAAWESWSNLHQRYEGPLRELVHRSGVILQGLTYARSGAILAAGTTSLPEGIGTARTWDYRYTWVRDASLTMRGLFIAACPEEASKFFAFLARATSTQLQRGLPMQIMFGIGGERDLTERSHPQLRGWRDSAPVRTGNGAWAQRQQDIYGALLDAAYTLRNQLPDLAEPSRELLIAAVEAAAEGWQTPDFGIWEIRGPQRRYLHSTLMCWVALDRGIALADMLGATDRLERWARVRDEIRHAIVAEGWNAAEGAYTQSFGSRELDGSALLLVLTGFLPPDDPKFAATLERIMGELVDERGLVRRYTADDGLAGEEGSFLLCTFWLAEALATVGRTEEAQGVLIRGAGYANDLGLLAEQVDSETGELLGNFPQAFSHLGLVIAAEALSDARARQLK